MTRHRPLLLLLVAAAACGLARVLFAAESAKSTAPAAPPPVDTVITSDYFDMVSTDKETTFTYRDNVVVTATNLKMSCDLLVVIARRSGDPKATVGKQEKLKSLVATGRVRLVQSDREATCGRAEILPDDDKVVLSDSPVIRGLGEDAWSQTGEKMTLHRGQRRAEVTGSGATRPQTTLPTLKDLGFDPVPEKKKPANAAVPDAPNAVVDPAKSPDSSAAPAPTAAPATVTVPLPPSPAPPK